MKPTDRRLLLGELHLLDGLISVLQEGGVRMQDKFTSHEDACCGAITATAQDDGNRFRFSPRDREILGRIRELESQLESAPTLGQLVEIRGELLQKARG
jgi:hypothetical protein